MNETYLLQELKVILAEYIMEWDHMGCIVHYLVLGRFASMLFPGRLVIAA